MTRRDREPPNQSWLVSYFGSELRALREEAGMTQTELGRLALQSPKTISDYESGKLVPRREFAELADAALGAKGMLVRLWQAMTDGTYPTWFHWYAQLEERAREIKHFEATMVPGLLQSEEYVRAMFRIDEPPKNDEEFERHVAARLKRQQIIFREDPPEYWAILDEAVLHRWPKDRSIIKPQLEHLLELGQLQHVHLHVIPFASGFHPCMAGFMALLSVDSHDDYAYVEPPGGGLLRTDPKSVATYRRRYDVLLSETLSAHDSEQMILAARESL